MDIKKERSAASKLNFRIADFQRCRGVQYSSDFIIPNLSLDHAVVYHQLSSRISK